jgi:NADH-quinone oxidoreductase subunit K
LIALEYELVLSAVLFAIGIYGILRRKNAIVVLMSVEII